MTQVSLPNEKFLQKEFVVPTVFKIMEPYLSFVDLLPKVKTDSRAVRYKKESVSASTDTKKRKPTTRTPSARFPFVDVSTISIESALLNQEGFAIRIDEDAVQFTEGIDQINRAFNRVGYWLAQDVNTQTGDALTDGATTPTWTPTAVWSDATATPIDDLIRLSAQMDREGYPYAMTDVYIQYQNYTEMLQYLTAIDISADKQKTLYGVPNMTRRDIDIPVLGATVHSLKSGITEGNVLAMDKDSPAGTIFYNNNPKYSTSNITYQTGDGESKTVPNVGFNYNTYVEDDTHDTVMQFWVDQVTVVKEPYAALYDSGI